MIKKEFLNYYLQNIDDINFAYDILINFQNKYGKKFVENMTVDEYCIGFGDNNTYSYQLEFGTNLLGSIKGGSSYKFGVFYSKSNEDYKFSSKFKNEQDALEKIRNYILFSINNSNYLDNYKFSYIPNLIRHKIYYLYNPTKILPIFSQNILEIFIEKFGLKEKCINQDFLSKNIILKEFLLEQIDEELVNNNKIEKIIIGLMYYLFSNIDKDYQYNIIFSDDLDFIKNFIKKDEGIGILIKKYNWDDYGYETTYLLKLFDKENPYGTEIGKTKIINKSQNILDIDFGFPFEKISEDFCSFANDEFFYIKIKEDLGQELAKEMLSRINDLIFKDEDFINSFSHLAVFKASLLRDSGVNYINICKDKFELDNNEFNKKNYLKHPFGLLDIQIDYLKSKYRINIGFDFKYTSFGLHRINAIIGKNGIGKSTTLNKIAYLLTIHKSQLDILRETDKITFFDNKDYNIAELYDSNITKKNFSKIIGISYGLFNLNENRYDIEEVEEIEKNKNNCNNIGFSFLINSENGAYCNNNLSIYDKIENLKNNNKSNYFLQKVIKTFDNNDNKSFDIKHIIEYPHKSDELSSGNKVLLSTIIDVITNIQPNSLILFDEPETHLHPEFVSLLIKIIYNLLEEFNSYMIIGTHSPIIIQQIPSKYVTKIVDDGDVITANNLSIESFGNNLSEIIYDVFGGDRTNTFFKEKLIEIKNKGYSKEEVLSFFNNDVPLGVSLFIENLYSNKEF